MNRSRSGWLAASLAGAFTTLLGITGSGHAADNEAELRALIEKQGQEIQALKQQMEAQKAQAAAKDAADKDADGKDADGKAPMTEKTVKKLVADYLKENPGAGMPPSVQTGYDPAGGFVIRSAPAPQYVKWEDESRIPFELRFRGRIQLDYYGYKVADNLNHETLAHYNPAVGDFSQLEIKRLRLIWEGTAFDPNLRYHFELDGNTRGLGGTQNNRQISSDDPAAAGGAPGIGSPAGSPIGGGVTVDHAVRLFSAYVAYDWHPCNSQKGCGPDCPDGTYLYTPTVSFIFGKFKPLYAMEEYFGSGNEQMVEYGMTEWMFDADNDNLQMNAGVQIKAYDDRLFASFLITNGVEDQFPNVQLDRLPGLNVGFWYDFGGTWNEQRHRWNLFGDTISDLDYSCNPVFRAGFTSNLVPEDRRSIYGDDETSFYFVGPGAPGGTRLINLLNGAGNPLHAVDSFDSYSLEAFYAAKYRGWSFFNDWFYRDLDNFKTVRAGGNEILYTGVGAANAAAVFHRGALQDFGTEFQGGYMVVPKKLELVARVDVIEGESGDIAGRPGVTQANAFTHPRAAYEYGLGFNYFWKGELLKWTTDLSYYQGGNPAGGGSSPAGFIVGVDGWLLRSQIQLAF